MLRKSALQPFQIETVSRLVSDIGSFAAIGIPTGGGKTVSTVLGGVVFCAMLVGDIQKTLLLEKDSIMLSNKSGVLRQTVLNVLPVKRPGRKVVVFVGFHLVTQWIEQANVAKELLKEVAGVKGWRVSRPTQ